MEKIRSFISFQVPEMPPIEDVKQELKKIGGVGVPKEMHLTLRFLGDVEVKKLNELAVKMKGLEKNRPFDVLLKGVGAFPDAKNPKVVWIGASLERTFFDILSELDGMLNALSIDYDKRKFKAHVTVGRVRKGSKELAEMINSRSDVEIGTFRCTEIFLMKSVLTPDGAEHSAIGTYRFTDS